MSEHCEYCGYFPCICGGGVHDMLYGEVPKYSKEWWKQQRVRKDFKGNNKTKSNKSEI